MDVDLEEVAAPAVKAPLLLPEQVVRVVIEHGELGDREAWKIRPEGARSISKMFASEQEALAVARAKFPNAAIEREDATKEYRKDHPMQDVAQKCANVRGWIACQRIVGEGFKPLEMSPPRQLEKGPELVESSFAEIASAKCARRVPAKDMVPASKGGKVCETTGKVPRCSEVTFVNASMSAATGVPTGPAVRLCPRPGEKGPLVPVRTVQESLDASRKFCRSRVAPEGAPIGWAGDVTLEHPEGEEEEIS